MTGSDHDSYHVACDVDDMEDGESRMIVVGDRKIGLFRVGDEYFAIDNDCPHAGASLAHGLCDGDLIRCRIHHWGFRLRDGVYVDEDKPEYNVRTYPIEIVDRQVRIDLR